MMACCASNIAVQLVLHSLPMETSELCVRPGRMGASRAALGRVVNVSSHSSLVDWSMFPLGRLTMMDKVPLILPTRPT